MTMPLARVNLGGGGGGNNDIVSESDTRGFNFRLGGAYTLTAASVRVISAQAGQGLALWIYVLDEALGGITRLHALGSVDLSTTGVKTLTGTWALPDTTLWIVYAGTSSGTVSMGRANTAPSPQWSPGTHENQFTPSTSHFGGVRVSGLTPPTTITPANAHTVGNDRSLPAVHLTLAAA